MPTSTHTNSNSTTAGRSRFATIATRLGAGVGVSLAALTILGGSAFAESGEPGPIPIIPFTPVDLTPEFEFAPIDLPSIELDDLTVPSDDGDEPPVFEIPEFEVPEIEIIPEDLPELPLCKVWTPAGVTVTHVDNLDGTATATISYTDPDNVCDELFVVHSIAEDELMNPLGLLAEEHITIAELAADPDNSIAVVVPLDPCYTRVLTNGPEAVVLADNHFGTGCPVPTETTEPTDPTVPPTDPTVPPTVPSDPTVPPTVPGSQTLPQTGSPSMVIALLGGALMLAGGALAIGVRQSQTSC